MTGKFDQDVREALSYVGANLADWVLPTPGIDHNVLIVGAGQSGSALAFALRKIGLGGVSVIDAGDESQSGIWDRCARMRTLRSGKEVIGPDLGVIPLSFRVWYDNWKGEGAYAALGRIPTGDWSSYLRWFRSVAAGPVRYGTRLTRIEGEGEYLRAHLAGGDGPRVETARKIVFAGGIEGIGTPRIPAELASLPREALAHTGDQINFASLRGRDVSVIGVGPSGFDAAAVALEEGARTVHMFGRRTEIPSFVTGRTRRYFPAQENFPLLPDTIRWRLMAEARACGNPPPPDSIQRATRFPNFHLHLGAQLSGAVLRDGRVALEDRGEVFEADFVIAATGYTQAIRERAEFAAVADRIALWGDRVTAPPGQENPGLAAQPYLGPAFQCHEREEGSAPFLRNLHIFTYVASGSFGRHVSDIPSLEPGIRRLAHGLADDLFNADIDRYVEAMWAWPKADFTPEFYAASIWNRQDEPLPKVART